MRYILIYYVFYFLSNFHQNLAFQIIQSTLIIFFNTRSLAVKFVLRFVTSEFSGDGILKVILIGSFRLSNKIF